MSQMTMRERQLAVVEGREHDQVPFCQYVGVGPSMEDAWEVVGKDCFGAMPGASIHAIETPNCRYEWEESQREGQPYYYARLITPEGTLNAEYRLQRDLGVMVAAKHYVVDPEDYRPLLAYLRDQRFRPNPESYLEADASVGENGLPHTWGIRTVWQALWVEWVDATDLAYHVADEPELMEEVFATLEANQTKYFKVAAEACKQAPVPYISLGDNITASMIGEHYFRRFCLPAYEEFKGLLADAGVATQVFVHMDGDLAPLWSAIAESAVTGLDSFSPQPDNDTSVAQAREQWPEMALLVNFPSSIHLAPPADVYRVAMELMQQNGRQGRLQIQISENPPMTRWRDSYAAIAQAVRDFGRACC